MLKLMLQNKLKLQNVQLPYGNLNLFHKPFSKCPQLGSTDEENHKINKKINKCSYKPGFIRTGELKLSVWCGKPWIELQSRFVIRC